MNIEFKSNLSELSKLGLLDVYIKRKLKKYYSNEIKKVNPLQQTKIVKEWKEKNSITSDSQLDSWLRLYEINFEEWIDFINSDYVWALWCTKKYENQLSDYYQIRKSELDTFFYSIIKVVNKDLADELYMRIKGEESTFEEIAVEFAEGNEKYSNGRIGPIAIANIESSIASLIKVGSEKQLWEPKSTNGFWFILRLDKIIHAKFNNQMKIKLALELGDKFLNKKFYEIQNKS